MARLTVSRAYLKELERIIIDAVSGMDPDDAIGTVKVHYSDGSARWLVSVIEQANELRDELTRKRARK